MKSVKEVSLMHNGYLVTFHEDVAEAIEHFDIILQSRQKQKPKKVFELMQDNIILIMYQHKNKRIEMFCIESIKQ
jgi:hypothetical protein